MQWVHDPRGRSGCYPELTSFGSVVVGLLQIHRDFQQSTELHEKLARQKEARKAAEDAQRTALVALIIESSTTIMQAYARRWLARRRLSRIRVKAADPRRTPSPTELLQLLDVELSELDRLQVGSQ